MFRSNNNNVEILEVPTIISTDYSEVATQKYSIASQLEFNVPASSQGSSNTSHQSDFMTVEQLHLGYLNTDKYNDVSRSSSLQTIDDR